MKKRWEQIPARMLLQRAADDKLNKFSAHFREHIPIKGHSADVISDRWNYIFEMPVDDFFAEFRHFNTPESKELKTAIEKLYGEFALLKEKYRAAHVELLKIHRIGMCIAECPTFQTNDTETVRMVKEMAMRLWHNDTAKGIETA